MRSPYYVHEKARRMIAEIKKRQRAAFNKPRQYGEKLGGAEYDDWVGYLRSRPRKGYR